MDLVSNKSHHQFFKKLVSLWFLPILIFFAGCAENQKDQPNVILVMADDMAGFRLVANAQDGIDWPYP